MPAPAATNVARVRLMDLTLTAAERRIERAAVSDLDAEMRMSGRRESDGATVALDHGAEIRFALSR